MKEYECVSISEESHIGHARRAVRRRSTEMGFSERRVAEIDIVIKEIGTNAVKFGRGTGQIYFARTDENLEPPGLEIIYIDKGPGIENTDLAVEDGYTTSGSMGAGLGAISRMADEFYIHSAVESQTRRLPMYGRTTHGTAIVVRKYNTTPDEPLRNSPVRWGVFTRQPEGETKNGDGYVIKRSEDRQVLAMIDGLGHGLGAMEAAQQAVTAIEDNASQPVEIILRHTHEALRSTRGAVVGLAAIDYATGSIEYAGIGNTDFRVLGGREPLRFISLNGTLGSRLERIRVFKEQLPKVATIIMSTDGISDRWSPEDYPGLLAMHPQLICAVLMRDFSRPKDDATILCGRLNI